MPIHGLSVLLGMCHSLNIEIFTDETNNGGGKRGQIPGLAPTKHTEHASTFESNGIAKNDARRVRTLGNVSQELFVF